MKHKSYISVITNCFLALIVMLAATGTGFSQKKPQTQKSIETVSCDSLLHKATLGHDNNGCFIDITVCYPWSSVGNPQVKQFPFGIEALLPPVGPGGTYGGVTYPAVSSQGGVSITSAVPTPGTWVATTPTVMQNLGSTIPGYLYPSTREVRFSRTPGTAADAIPYCANYSNPQKFRIRITTTGTLNPIVLRVNLLNGYGCDDNPSNCSVMCTWDTVLTHGTLTPYVLTPASSSICAGSSTTINLTPAPPKWSVTTWYWCNTLSNGQCPPAVPPYSAWNCPNPDGTNGSPVSTVSPGGAGPIPFLTNPLQQGRCYLVVINDGCFSDTVTTQVHVCPPCDAISITTNPLLPNGHTCDHFTGTINLGYPDFVDCRPSITWTELTGSITIHKPAWKDSTTTPQFTLYGPYNGPVNSPNNSLRCDTTYTFNAHIVNACAPCDKAITIIVDRQLQPAEIQITSSKALPLCNGTGTILTANASCKATITNWDSSLTGLPGSFTEIPGAYGSTHWTNNLASTTWYQCDAVNGTCTTRSNALKVTVKCPLSVSIAANHLCVPDTLTATIPSCAGPATIKWYKDGVYISNAMKVTSNSTGSFWAEVYDAQCHESIISNVVTLCKDTVIITGEVCVCKDASGNYPDTFTATNVGCPGSTNCTYRWFKNNVLIPNAHSSTYSVLNIPNGYTTYSVQMKCLPCPMTSNSITVHRCP